MGSALKIGAVVLAIWVGFEVHTNGVDGAFGGVFASADEGEESGEPLYVQMHRIRSTEQTITVTVPRKPARAGIDVGVGKDFLVVRRRLWNVEFGGGFVGRSG